MNIYVEKDDYTELLVKTPSIKAIFLFDKDIANQMKKLGTWHYNSAAPHTLRCKTKDIDVYVRRYFNLGFPKVTQNADGKIIDFRNCKTNNYRDRMNSKELQTRVKSNSRIIQNNRINSAQTVSTNTTQINNKNTSIEKTNFIIIAKQHLFELLKEFGNNKGELIFLHQTVNQGKIETAATDISKRIPLEDIILVD